MKQLPSISAVTIIGDFINMEYGFLNFRLNFMDYEDGSRTFKRPILALNVIQGNPKLHDEVLLSPEHTCIDKSQPQVYAKSSNEILAQIYNILEPKPTLKHKESLKSVDRKDPNSNFKCKCKKTRCLKMYCQCFAMGKMCNGCNCCDCQNSTQFESARASAIDQALQRDPEVFVVGNIVKKGGCICKKTQCLKKYCECYSSGVPCTSECKCQNCSNTQ